MGHSLKRAIHQPDNDKPDALPRAFAGVQSGKVLTLSVMDMDGGGLSASQVSPLGTGRWNQTFKTPIQRI
ncbi:hypothetical protein C8N31_10238 [Sulfitobacter mediterraneus]|uniref:Uncharacterized protein n=1 Tax=Sulfitobacter mediterraneus TaxID=83219 RepID=A0A2T6CHG0_9RHOB|nr:hypothetical protein C8N31_10238 [Sulfitobacter mediterraneus]